jgi:hypothetical protein
VLDVVEQTLSARGGVAWVLLHAYPRYRFDPRSIERIAE